jgi:hypothetical protein
VVDCILHPSGKEYNVESFSPRSTLVSSIISLFPFPLSIFDGLFKSREKEIVRFELLAEMTMEIIISWDATACSQQVDMT